MTGRRSQSRVAFGNSRGVLTVSRDVLITAIEKDEFTAMSVVPHVPGDLLTIGLAGDTGPASERVQVISSRPVVVDGLVRHELRVARLGAGETQSDRSEARTR
jgi:hypothetical protein